MELTKEAQAVLDAVNAGQHPNELEGELYKHVTSWSCSDGFGYGLYEGGYIKPEMIVAGEDLVKLQEAVKTVGEFKELWQKISMEF